MNDMRRHSTATLMSLTKKELVEYVRMAEYNQDVAEETLKQQAENVKDWVPVVQCKDCSHRIYKDMGFDVGVIAGCELYGCATPNNHYCSFGEKVKVVLDNG